MYSASGVLVGVEESLLLEVGLDQADLLLRAAGEAQVAQRLVVDREDAAGRAVLGRHVGDRGAIGEREIVQAGAKEFDELADDAFLAQHLGHGEHEVGRGRAFAATGAVSRTPTTCGISMDTGWPSIAASASIPPTPQPEHAQAVDHGGVRVGADQRVGIGQRLARFAVRADEHDSRQIFEVDLVNDAGVRRHEAKFLNAVCPQRRKA